MPCATDGFFRNALESSPDCVQILDLSGNIQFINRNSLALLTLSEAQALSGAPWLNLWAEADQPVARAALDAATEGEPQRFTARIDAAGARRHFDCIVSPLRDDTGGLGGLLVTARDVTQFEEARLAAEARERQTVARERVLRSAAEMARLGGWEMDFRTDLVVRSEEVVRLLRGGPRELSPGPNLEMFPPEERPRIAQFLEQWRATGERISLEAPIVRYDGTRGWVRFFGEGIFEEGVCVGLRGAALDITEAKAAQDKIERAEQRLLLALQIAGMRVYDLDFERHTLTQYGSASASEDAELSFEDFWPPGSERVVDPRDADRVRAEWARAEQAGTPFRSEFRMIRRRGEEQWSFCVAEMKRDSSGQPLRLLVAAMDITERKRNEHAILQTLQQMREHEARQKLLLNELNHRVKNTLASVQSVAGQTLTDAREIGEARDLFIERLLALSATHNLLVKHAWEGASFRDLVEMTLKPYGQLYGYSGPDLRLDANFAVSIGMALHELATNAVKHGAWTQAGRVEIGVAETADAEAVIVWRESGGPPVTTPLRCGFGSRLLQRGVAAELGGQVALDFAADGLVCIIQTPLSSRLQVMHPQPAQKARA